MADTSYDLVVIGSGPAGFHAAIQAAKVQKRVALIERRNLLGGVCTNTGTIPSKTLREAVLMLAGQRRRVLAEEGYSPAAEIGIDELLNQCRAVMADQHEFFIQAIARNRIELVWGEARFADRRRIVVTGEPGPERLLEADHVVIAVGSRPAHPDGIAFDERDVLDSDGILLLDRIPRSLAVIGAGVIGCEYASIFAALGVRVSLIDHHPEILEFADREIVDALMTSFRENVDLNLDLGEQLAGLSRDAGLLHVLLASGKRIGVEKVLYCAGRDAATDRLAIENAGLTVDAHGHLTVDENYQTPVAGIYAAGDVIGFPSLASTSMEQGRVAACHAFDIPVSSVPAHFPFGIYTVPEISMVGSSEQDLRTTHVPYIVGRAYYRGIARGQIIGDVHGLVKLLFHLETKSLLGVHVIGEGATELVHIGQTALALGGTLSYFLNTVFNYPTLAEGYKIAALNAYDSLTDS